MSDRSIRTPRTRTGQALLAAVGRGHDWPDNPLTVIATIEDEARGPEHCPPHNFHVAASWEGEQSRGYIYCRACGEIRELIAQTLSAPAEERYTVVSPDHNTITATFEAGE